MPFSNIQKIGIHYDSAAVQNMINMLKAAPFPLQAPLDAEKPWDLGIDYDYLKNLKTTMETKWKWEDLEAKIGKYDHFLVDYKSEDGIDELTLHYVHAKSKRQDAIPLILMHGWPGTFFDFHKVIEPLTNPPSADLPAFHVVIPSIPGYFKSTLPRRDGWNLVDIAKLYHGLMFEALDYKKYVGQGGDWGSMILRIMSHRYADTLIGAHFNMFRSQDSDTPAESELSAVDKRILAGRQKFMKSGAGYFQIQSTKPFTIGLAIASSPLAVLAYIGEKIYSWSDPERVDPSDIIDTVALYFLSGSFATSVLIYNQSFKQREGEEVTPAASIAWKVKSKFGYSSFPFEIGGSPKAVLNAYGPLDFYREHENGGHFPALDSAKEFIEDLRDFFGKIYA